jgi:dethiobiotin synthetase
VKGVFIAGTDTGVGKTRIARAIVRALVRDGMRVAAMKPVAAGADATSEGLRNVDALELARAANVPAPYEIVNPYCAPLAASAHIATREAGIVIDLAVIRQRFSELAALSDIVIVEGAGGWLAPISETETMADVAVSLDLPVVLVVGLRLGCLSHALLTAQSIQSQELELAGWIANCVQPHFERADENIATLQHRLSGPLLAAVAHDALAFESPQSVKQLKDALRLW